MFSFSLFFSSFLSQLYQVADLRGDNKGQLPLPQGVKASLASLFLEILRPFKEWEQVKKFLKPIG